VDSVLRQVDCDLERILVDDGSPDRCGVMCDHWGARDDRIRVIHQQNGGLSAARNTGIRHATGDYLIFLDSDDWWENNSVLTSLAAQLNQLQVDVLTFNYRKSYGDTLTPTYFDQRIPSDQSARSIAELVRNHLWVCSSWNKVVRRSLFDQGGLFFREGIVSEDIDWSVRLALQADTFAFVNICVLVYRQRPMSITQSISLKSVEMLCGNIKYSAALLKEAGRTAEDSLNSYLAYQYATLVYNVAGLSKADRKNFMEDLRAMQYLLDCSDHAKVRLIARCRRFLGLGATIALLKVYNGLRQCRQGRKS
jgi:glycosyltransferase involved in cell wall biosynthesis